MYSPQDLSRLKLQKLQSLLPPPPPPLPTFQNALPPFKDSILTEGGGCNTQEKLKTKIMQSFLGGGGGGKQDVLWEMWKWRIAYGCGAHLGLVFLLEAALFLRVSNCSVIFLSFVRKLAVTKG